MQICAKSVGEQIFQHPNPDKLEERAWFWYNSAVKLFLNRYKIVNLLESWNFFRGEDIQTTTTTHAHNISTNLKETLQLSVTFYICHYKLTSNASPHVAKWFFWNDIWLECLSTWKFKFRRRLKMKSMLRAEQTRAWRMPGCRVVVTK